MKIKYPKILLLLLTFLIAYFLFQGREIIFLHDTITSLGYLGTFLAGILFTYGFTAAPATVILLILSKEQNIIISGLTAGLGALLGDIIIFKFIRYYFADEIKKMSNEKILIKIKNKF